MLRRLARGLATALTLAAATAAQADLARVGPINTVNGFPKWYQDQSGQVLDLCLPDATDPGSLQFNACLLALPPPFSFPSNFPDEAFYFRAVADTPVGTGGQRAVLVLALEAAFASGAPAIGQQVVFTRIRVTAGVPFDGDYKVTHPYGEETFVGVVSSGGNRDITFTEDVGITPGEFTAALNSRVGPFLRRADGTTVTLNGATFLSDGVTPEAVSGSPYGTNYFQICGPLPVGGPNYSCNRTDVFALTGRVHDFAAEPIGSPLTIERATYARDVAAGGTYVDVAASVVPGLLPNGTLQASPKLSMGTSNLPPVLMRGPDEPHLGHYYGQALANPPSSIPAFVTVTNSGDVPPSSATRRVVDAVTVTRADYDPGTGDLVVVATSSDKGDAAGVRPQLILQGFPSASLTPGGIAGDPSAVTFVANTSVPPATVSIESSKGGEGSLNVRMARAAAFPAGAPWTANDVASVVVNAAPITINPRLNDVAGAADPITLLDTTSPYGNAAVVSGNVQFTPGASVGTATFRYTLSNVVGTSNVSTITVFVNPGASGPVPITQPDSYTINAGSGRTLDVLANDSGNGGTLDLGSVAIVAGPTAGTASVNTANGTINYTAPGGATTATLNYTVKNTNGNVSAPTTVTLNVIAPETILVSRARCQGNNRWDVRGTSSVTSGNTITLFLTGTVPDNPLPSQTIGSVPVDALGNWQFQLAGGAACRTPISLQSTLGTKVNNITVQLR